MRAGEVALASSGVSLDKQGSNTSEFFPQQPDQMGLWPKGVYGRLRVLEETNQYFKRMHEHCFHAGNASGRVPEKSRK